MRNRIFIVLSFLTLIMGCKKAQEEYTEYQTRENESQLLTEKEVSKFKYVDYILDSATHELAKDWTEYMQFNDAVLKIKKGDWTFFKDNEEVIELLIYEHKLNIPETLKSESVISRLVILETRLLKLKSLTNLSTINKKELIENTKAFLVAFSNLNFQLNKKVEFTKRTIERP